MGPNAAVSGKFGVDWVCAIKAQKRATENLSGADRRVLDSLVMSLLS